MTNNISIQRDNIRTMQKDIKGSRIKKIDIKAPVKTPTLAEPVKKPISPLMSEQSNDLKMPTPTKMPEAMPGQKPEQNQMSKSTLEKPKAEETRKINESGDFKKQDSYREPI